MLYDIVDNDNRDAIFDAFRNFEDSRRVFDAVWIVTTSKTAAKIVEAITPHCKKESVVTVSEIDDGADFACGGGDGTFDSWFSRLSRLEK